MFFSGIVDITGICILESIKYPNMLFPGISGSKCQTCTRVWSRAWERLGTNAKKQLQRYSNLRGSFQEPSPTVLPGPARLGNQCWTSCACLWLSRRERQSILVVEHYLILRVKVFWQLCTFLRYYRADGRITRDWMCMVRHINPFITWLPIKVVF